MNWNELAGRGYVILNMTQNMNCVSFGCVFLCVSICVCPCVCVFVCFHKCVFLLIHVCAQICVLQEEFRAHQGVQLLKIIERVFSQKMNSPEGSWVLYLSKPTHHQHQLLMNVASGRGTHSDMLNTHTQLEAHTNKDANRQTTTCVQSFPTN